MPASHRIFGNLLEEGIKRVHITRKKPIGYILDEFGYELRPDDSSKGRYALGHWYYKKRIPASMEDVTRLATLIVTNSDVDREWLKAFLDSAGYPESDQFCDKFFLPPQKTVTVSEIPPEEAAPAPDVPKALIEENPPAKPKRSWVLYALGSFMVLALLAFSWNQFSTVNSKNDADPTRQSTSMADQPASPTKRPTEKPAVTSAEIPPSPVATATVIALDGKCPDAGAGTAFEYISPSSFKDFLNSGGSFNTLKDGVNSLIGKRFGLRGGQIVGTDLNQDGVPEIIVSVTTEGGSIWQVLGCSDGQYQALEDLQEENIRELRYAVDLNGNKYPEMISYRQTQSDNIPMVEFLVQEWNGRQLAELMDNTRFDEVGKRIPSDITDWSRTVANATGTTADVNQDGLYELIVTGGLRSSVATCETRFDREFTETWAWNGKSLQLVDRTYTPPVYRFQRSADGDLAFALNHLDQALDAYQDVLFEAGLYGRDQYISQLEQCKDLGPKVDDALLRNEMDQLSAYARWRILLINALKDSPDAMQVVHDTLQEKFPQGKPGHAYAIIASKFWESYQKTQNLEDACVAANLAAQNQALYLSHQAENICFIP